jgi:hypothetical protein
MILVMHALQRLVIPDNPGKKAETTHKDPKANRKSIVILFFKLRLKPLISATGNNMSIKSSAMPRPAPANMIAWELIHFPLMVRSQTAATGTHWKMMAISNATIRKNIHAMASFVARRKLQLGKIRRYRKRMENLARFWVTA